MKANKPIRLTATIVLTIFSILGTTPCLAAGNQRYFRQNQPAAPAASNPAPAEPPAATTGPATVQAGSYAGRFWMFTMVLQVAGQASGTVSGTSTITDTDNGRIQVDRFNVPVASSGNFVFQLSTGSILRLQPCGTDLCGSVESAVQHARTNLTLARQ